MFSKLIPQYFSGYFAMSLVSGAHLGDDASKVRHISCDKLIIGFRMKPLP